MAKDSKNLSQRVIILLNLVTLIVSKRLNRLLCTLNFNFEILF